MTEKRALTAVILLCAAVLLAPGASEAKKKKPQAKQKRPNIVVIMDDDQSTQLQGFLSKTNAAIGGRGVTFDNSFVNYSLCCPSRSTLLTGQYAHNHGVRGKTSRRVDTASWRRRSPTPCRPGSSERGTTRATSASS